MGGISRKRGSVEIGVFGVELGVLVDSFFEFGLVGFYLSFF